MTVLTTTSTVSEQPKAQPAPQAALHAASLDVATEYTWLDHRMRRGLDLFSGMAGYKLVIGAPRQDADAVFTEVCGPRPPIPPELNHLRERYDNAETIIVAYYRGRPVGTVSMYTMHGGGRTLEAFPTQLPRGVSADDVLDIGRLLIRKEHRGGSRLALLGLLNAATHFSTASTRTFWVGVTSLKLLQLFRYMNPTAQQLPIVDNRPEATELQRYWDAYRGGPPKDVLPFIMRHDGAVPRAVIGRHIRNQLLRWS